MLQLSAGRERSRRWSCHTEGLQVGARDGDLCVRTADSRMGISDRYLDGKGTEEGGSGGVVIHEVDSHIILCYKQYTLYLCDIDY